MLSPQKTLAALAVTGLFALACSQDGGSPLGVSNNPFGEGIERASHDVASEGVIDFESASEGDENPTITAGALTVTTSADANSGANCFDTALIYDTDTGNPNDPDLNAQSQQSNVLVIEEDGPLDAEGENTSGSVDPDQPDDCQIGGTLSVDFSGDVTFESIKVLDIEGSSGNSIEIFDDGVSVGTFNIPATGDAGIVTVDLSDTVGDSLVTTIDTSAAIDDIEFFVPEVGGEGCTPGFWKNNLTRWPAGFDPGDDFDTVFGTDLFDPDLTLLEALNNGGGGVDALGRHAVAALLNAAHPDTDFGFTTAEVIDLVQDVDAGTVSAEDAKNQLAIENELGCDIPGDGNADNGNTNSNSNGNGNGNGNRGGRG